MNRSDPPPRSVTNRTTSSPGENAPGFTRILVSSFVATTESSTKETTMKPTSLIPNDCRWIFAVSMLSAVFLRLDVFFLGATWSDADVGVYSVALTMIYPITQLSNSLATVLIPDVSTIRSKKELHRYMTGSLRYSVPISAALLLFAVSWLPDEFIRIFFGSGYEASGEPFKALVISASAILVSTPTYLAVYPIGKPAVLAAGDVVKLVLHVIAYSLLVPGMGVMGAAWGNVAAMVTGSAISVGLVLYELKRTDWERVQNGDSLRQDTL